MQFKVEVRVTCSSVDKAPRWLGGGADLENTEICCGFFRLDAVLLYSISLS
jgi:hypothetical protein